MLKADNIDGHKAIVFCVDHYNPLGLIRSLGEAGITPIVIVVSENPLLVPASKYVSKLHNVANIKDGFELLMNLYANTNNKPLVFTASDDIEQFLDSRYNALKDSVIFFDGGSEGSISRYMDKHEIMLAAKEAGLRVPTAEVVNRGELPQNVPYPVITKSIASTVGGWKDDVFVCNNEEELKEAFNKIKSPIVLVEEYIIKKNELCIDGISFDGGEVVYMPLKCNYIRFSDKAYGNYMTMSPFNDPILYKKIQKLFKITGFSGMFSIEFLITNDDNLVFLEINFRHSTWGYSSTYVGANLPYIWAKYAVGQGIVLPNKIKGKPFKAIADLNDFIDSVPTHRVGLVRWLWEYMTCDCHYVFNHKDPMPMVKFIARHVSRIFKR